MQSFQGFVCDLMSTDEGSSDWAATLAGIAVLQLAYASVYFDRTDLAVQGGMTVSDLARDCVRSVDDIALRSVLDNIRRLAESLDESLEARLTSLSGRVFAYTKILENSAKWQSAGDAARLANRFGILCGERELAVMAKLEEGFCARRSGNRDDAMRCYSEAAQLATTLAPTFAFSARLGMACVAIEAEEYAEASERLDMIIIDATIADERPSLARALIDRGTVAGILEDYPNVVVLGQQALELLTDTRNRDVVLGNMARAYRLMNEPAIATEIAECLSTHATEREKRWLADILLMQMAIDSGRYSQFRDLVKKLGAEPLSPRVLAEYLEAFCRGLAAWGFWKRSIRIAERMIAVSREHGLVSQLRRATQLLADVNDEIVPPPAEYAPPLAEAQKQLVRSVATKTHELLSVS